MFMVAFTIRKVHTINTLVRSQRKYICIQNALCIAKSCNSFIQLEPECKIVEYASPRDYYKSKFTPDLRGMLDFSLYNRWKSDGSPGITCEWFSLGKNCLRDLLWCRVDFKVPCARGLSSNNEVLYGNRR